jgi:hypothetical protein
VAPPDSEGGRRALSNGRSVVQEELPGSTERRDGTPHFARNRFSNSAWDRRAFIHKNQPLGLGLRLVYHCIVYYPLLHSYVGSANRCPFREARDL